MLVTKGKEKRILSSLESWRHPGLLTRGSFLFFRPVIVGMEPPSRGHTLLNGGGGGTNKKDRFRFDLLETKIQKGLGFRERLSNSVIS